MPESTGQNFFLGLFTDADKTAQIYVNALNQVRAASAQTSQALRTDSAKIGAGIADTLSQLTKMREAAEALKRASAATAGAGPVIPLTAQRAVAGAGPVIPLQSGTALRQAEAAARAASQATSIYNKLLEQQQHDYVMVGQASTKYLDSLIRQRTVTRELREEAEALAAANRAVAGAGAPGGHPAWFGAGPVTPIGLRNVAKPLGVQSTILPGISDPRMLVAANQALGERAGITLRAAAAEKAFSFEVNKHLSAEIGLASGLGHSQQQLISRHRITGELISGEIKYAAALQASAQAATTAAMAQAKAAALAQFNQTQLQAKAAQPFYTSGIATARQQGGGGGGGGAGVGFLGGRGSLLDQVISTARISALYGGMYTALFAFAGFLQQSISSFSQFQVSIQDLADITGQSVAQVAEFATSIADIGTQFGVASDAAIRVAAQTRGIDPTASNLAVAEAVRAVSQTAMVTGASAEEISQAANAIAVAYDISAKTVLDASNALDRRLGVLTPTIGGQGRVAVLAQQAGISQPELAAMFSLLTARLNRSPEDIAGALGQVLSRTDIVDLTELGATAGKSFADQLKEVGALSATISDAQLTAVANKFGRGSSGQTALELFRSMPQIQALAAQPTAGRTEELAAARLRTFSGAMQSLQGSFEKLANTIGQTGIYSGLIALALAAKAAAEVLNALLKPLTLIPGPLRDLAFAAAEAAVVLTLLGRGAVIKALATGTAGAAAGSGSISAIAARSLQLGAARVGSGLLTLAGKFGPLGLAATATAGAVTIMHDVLGANAAAHENLRTALNDTTSSSEDLADAAQMSADSLKDQSLINRIALSSQQSSMEELARVTRSISEIKLEPEGLVKTATQALTGDTGITGAFQQLVASGNSQADALRAVATALAVQGGKEQEIPGAPGGGPVERAKTELSRLATIPAAGVKSPMGVGMFHWEWEWEYHMKDIGQGMIDAAIAELKSKLESGQALTSEDLQDYIDAIVDAYEIPPEARDDVRRALEAAAQNSLKNIQGTGNLLKDNLAGILNKYSEEINNATSGLLANVPKAAGKDLKFSASETERFFKELKAGRTGLLQEGSKVAVIQQEINELKNQVEIAVAMEDKEGIAAAVEQLTIAENLMADELIEPAMKLLTATFGDLTTKEKTKAEIKSMTNAILSLIPKIASSGEAMVTLITGLDAAGRAMIRAELIAQRDAARAAVKSAEAKLAATSIGGPYAFMGDLADALAGRNKVSDALTQRKAELDAIQKQLDAFDKAMSAEPRGTASDKVTATKEKAPKDIKKDTQAQIDAAKLLAEATKVADPVKIAAAELEVAKADLAAVAAESGRNSVAYWNAMAGVYQAMQDLADAQVQAAHQGRLLTIDLTNPVQQAKAEYDLALAQYNSLKNQGLSQNALNPALVDVRNKEAALQDAKFQQMLGDLQTNEQLKRIGHQEYIRSLQAERDRLAAQRALLSTNSNMYRQITDQINQIDQLLMQTTESMNTMFNLGDIKLPTVYEVRRFMDSAFEGVNFLADNIGQNMGGHMAAAVQPGGQVAPVNNDNRQIQIFIDGGDLAAVQQAVADAAGVDQQVVGARPHKF